MNAHAALPLAILISGRGSNMVAIAQACAAGRIDARVNQVISDQLDAAGVARAGELGLATRVIPRPLFADAAGFETALLNLHGETASLIGEVRHGARGVVIAE